MTETEAGAADEPTPGSGQSQQHIAVSLSGGGHRASLFGLGALLYLADAGKGPELANITSISGGSLTNAHVGLTTDMTSIATDAEKQRFWDDVKPLAQTVATKGTLWAWWGTYAYLLLLLGVLGVATWLCFPLGLWSSVGVWVAALTVFFWLLSKRSVVARSAFDAKLLKGRSVSAMNKKIDHVIAAADLQTAEPVYFSSRFVYSYRLGWGQPNDLKAAWAAQASACLPGAFTPVAKPASAFGFANSRPDPPDRVLLVDGGVYDNMGTQWPMSVHRRLGGADVPQPAPVVPNEMVVVNGSAAMEVVPRRTARWPLIGEFTSLLADKDIMYDQTTAVRRRLLFARFKATREGRPEPPMSGVIAQINRSPLSLAGAFMGGSDAAAVRASNAHRQLSAVPDWDDDVTNNSNVGTTLSKIDADRAARLLRHSYALVMAEAHVLLGYPLLPLPNLQRFRSLVDS